jgi:hypothetical protein
VLSVIVVPLVDDHLAHSKKLTQLLQTRQTLLALGHHELVGHLIPGPVAASVCLASLLDETDREAPLSVYKTNYPASSDQPFLLIFRTVRIVTVHDLAV